MINRFQISTQHLQMYQKSSSFWMII